MGGQGQFVISSDAPTYPIAKSLTVGDDFASSIGFPSNAQGQINAIAIDSYTGRIIFAGETGLGDSFAIFTGSVASSSVTPVFFSAEQDPAEFFGVAFDSKGNAILVGQGGESGILPAAYRLSTGSNELTSIALPGIDEGSINAVAFFPNNTAVLVGIDNTSSGPLIYLIPEGASEAALISLPDPSITGQLTCLAITPSGTAILGGTNFTDNNSLIYRLTEGSLTATAVSVPNTGDESHINAVAVTSDGTAVFGGNTTTLPVIYTLSQGESSASAIANANGNDGIIYCVAIGPDNIAILGGQDNTTGLPLIYRLAQGSSSATSVSPPSSLSGVIIAAAIGNQNVATLVGATDDSNPFAYTLGAQDSVASNIPISNPFTEGGFFTVAVYSCNGLYDIKRIRPYYYFQMDETINALQQSGLL